jgi:glycosyltransferase involved in cell wall biosynthesis
MAAGVPIIARSVGGVPDVVSDREALLVSSADPAALGAALGSVIADPGAARARSLAALQRLDQHRPGPWIARYEALYHGVLASSRSRSSA